MGRQYSVDYTELTPTDIRAVSMWGNTGMFPGALSGGGTSVHTLRGGRVS